MSSSFTRAGTILEHQGFKQYVQQLDEIDKKQREAFDREFKGTGKSFSQVQKAARDYENQLKSLEKQYNQAVAAEQKQVNQLKSLEKQYNQAVAQEKRLADEQKKRRNALVIGTAAFAAREVFQFTRESADLAREQAKAEAQLAAAIQSTGGAAGLGSNQLRSLADELQNTTNFSDQATIQAEALLLTFTNIRGITFERAVRAIQDVSTAMDQDLGQSAIQVGKALNDPIRGLASLRDVGIQFTAAQEAQIRRFVEVNDLAAAQGVILAELERQFGGSAEAAREADGGFTALSNSFGDFREQLGGLVTDLGTATGATQGAIGVIDALTNSFRGARAELGLGTTADAVAGLKQEIAGLEKARAELAGGGGPLTSRFLDLLGLVNIEDDVAFVDQQIEKLQAELSQLQMKATAEDAEELAQAQENAAVATQENAEANEELQKALQGAVRQAEQLAINFARAQEDAQRKAARQTAKLERDQAKAREKLLVQQQKQLDKLETDRLERLADFEEDRAKQIADTEKDIAKEEARAQRDRQRQQENFQRQLRQAEERFNLSRIQSQRRFLIEDERLRGEGDILGLMALRQQHELEQLEASENFDLQQRQTKEGQEEQTKDQEEEQRDRLAELKQHLEEQRIELEESLEEQRADLLAGFDEQLADLQVSQLEQREALAESLAQAEEDRRISQQRQLEDLGRSLAAQEDLTAEGAAAIAQQLEEAFGVEGVADQIMSGFTARQESAFQELFESITEGAKTTKKQLEELAGTGGTGVFGATGFEVQPVSPERVAGFQHGGSFEVGGTGGADSQLVAFRATPGERVTVTPQSQTFRMPIAAPSQLNVSFGGRSQIDVTGLEGASQATVDAAVEQMIQIQDIAIRRILRRHGVN